MYFKMAVNNVRKSFKEYTIYFLTLTFAVCIFYSFNSINSQTIMAELSNSQAKYVSLLNKFISVLSVGVSFILGGLIIYATNFLIRRRKKEFGIYMTLGMKKRSMSMILFLETLYIGAISLIAGILLGLIFAQVLSVFTAKLFAIEMTKYSFVISYESILKTILYFGLMFIVVMIFNVIVISKYKLIDLLYANRKNENIKIRNIYISLLILVLSISALGCAYYYIGISNLDYLQPPFRISIILGIIGTLLFFYGFSSVFMLILKKSGSIYFNELNSFSIRQIISKFNTNFISMSIICLMLLVTIGTLSCGITVKNGMEEALKNATPFDASITIENNNEENKTNVDIENVLKERGYNIGEYEESVVYYKSYNCKELPAREILRQYNTDKGMDDILSIQAFDTTEVMPVSVFNNIMKACGKKEVNLNDDEILIASNYEPFKAVIENFLNNEDYITIKNVQYKIKDKNIIKDSFITTPVDSNLFTIIVPDNLVEGMDMVEEVINLNFKDETEKDADKRLSEILYTDMNKESKETDQNYLHGMTRSMCYEANRGISTLVLFVAVYLGIVFLLASAAVLALQQLSSCNESLEGYKSLRKIGASRKMINKSIFIQVSAFFMLPLSLAIVHSYVGIKVVNSYLTALGSANQFHSILLTAAVIIVIYGGYLCATYISYKNVVNNEFDCSIS